MYLCICICVFACQTPGTSVLYRGLSKNIAHVWSTVQKNLWGENSQEAQSQLNQWCANQLFSQEGQEAVFPYWSSSVISPATFGVKSCFSETVWRTNTHHQRWLYTWSNCPKSHLSESSWCLNRRSSGRVSQCVISDVWYVMCDVWYVICVI